MYIATCNANSDQEFEWICEMKFYILLDKQLSITIFLKRSWRKM